MSLNPGSTLTKDPDAELLYTMDWSDWLVGAAQIVSSTWTITPPAGETVSTLTSSDESDTGTTTQLLLLGGTTGKTYRVTNEITTDETPAQTDDRSFFVKIAER